MGFIATFLFFIQSRGSIYYPLRLGFIYDTYNTITEHNQRQTRYLSLIPNYFDIYFLVSQKLIL